MASSAPLVWFKDATVEPTEFGRVISDNYWNSSDATGDCYYTIKSGFENMMKVKDN